MAEHKPHDPGPGRKPALQHVPAMLTGAAALIAALTTVYVNVRGDRQSAVPVQAPATTAPPTPPVTPDRPASDRLRLSVDRIAVEHDGSPGTTDWRFTVEAGGEPLFAFQQDGLDDHGGRNVAMPAQAAATALVRTGGKPVHVVVQGWRGTLFGSGAAPDATGEGVLMPSGTMPPVRVQAARPDAGAFVFYLSAERDDTPR